MKILLSALNAKYIHSSLSIRYLKHYVKKSGIDIITKEFTINHSMDYILREIYKQNPDILGFSCYIWNIELIYEIVTEYKKISPKTIIFLGGPEVSYDAEEVIRKHREVDFVIRGEGEETFREISNYYVNGIKNLEEINGITYQKNNEIISNAPRQAMNLDMLPFPYENELDEFKNRIIYYETSRGCPFNCQYCLSSIEKGVRFVSLEKAYRDLQKFLDAKVKQVKFVDRTFNCNKKHALGIWEYLKQHDNGVTNFHFEISADLLDEETLEFFKTIRPKLFQLEIGVQSTNTQTIKYIKRKMSVDKIFKVVKEIQKGKNIHQHLDLIAGLPGETYESFGHSFDDVYDVRPEQLQLGFLKVLKGSGLNNDQTKYGLVHKQKAPYEILETSELPYEHVLKLKMIEEMVEVYYNTGRFSNTVRYCEKYFDSPFKFYESLAQYWESKELHKVKHSKLDYYTHLKNFMDEKFEGKIDLLEWLMKYDILLHEKAKKIPQWMDKKLSLEYKNPIKQFYKDKQNIEKYLPQLTNYDTRQISHIAHIEVFPFDIINWDNENYKAELTAVLFNYNEKNIMLNKAKVYKIKLEMCDENER